MNPATEEEAIDLASNLTKLLGEEVCDLDEDSDSCTEVVIFPPHPFLSKVKDVVEEVGITVGAQSIFFEDKGAYTGSVAASMVKSVGCEYVLCGHSERRTLFSDSDDAINRKVRKVLEAGMKPILCIGETKEEYDLQIKNEVCAMQLSKDLVGVTKEQMKDVVIAYEPVWAIGTGLVCGAKDASKYFICFKLNHNLCLQLLNSLLLTSFLFHYKYKSHIDEVHVFLRGVLASLYDDEVAQATRIQYGGSVTPDSVDELMAQPDIDGCLVGGASLVADKFGRIINYVKI